MYHSGAEEQGGVRMKLVPSLMCIDFSILNDEVNRLNKTQIHGYHIDIMDGNFVPNLALGKNDIFGIRKLTNKEIDVHLMTENADRQVDYFFDMDIQSLCVHVEATKHLDRTIRKIKNSKIEAGIALNPSTSIHMIEDILQEIDYVLVMTVNPGFASQTYIDYCTHKIMKLIQLREEQQLNFEVMVDGAISETKIKLLNKIGVDSFVLGTSALFNKNEDYETIVNRIISFDNTETVLYPFA